MAGEGHGQRQGDPTTVICKAVRVSPRTCAVVLSVRCCFGGGRPIQPTNTEKGCELLESLILSNPFLWRGQLKVGNDNTKIFRFCFCGVNPLTQDTWKPGLFHPTLTFILIEPVFSSVAMVISPGPLELGVILLILVLLFGPDKIPKLARSTGEAVAEFQRGRKEIEQELETDENPFSEAPKEKQNEQSAEKQQDD